MRFYISVPMAGKEDLGWGLASEIQYAVQKRHDTSVIPHDIDAHQHTGECPPGYAGGQNGHSSACWLRGDIRRMLECDAIVFGPGWQHSVGCRLELQVATATGMPVYWYVDGTIKDALLRETTREGTG